jgi:hypothetical protein
VSGSSDSSDSYYSYYSYEYAVLRVVPRVERGEAINAGVVLYCPRRRFLEARVHLDHERLQALEPGLVALTVEEHLEAARRVCAGGAAAGALGGLSSRERFGRVVAPRSTIIQPSPVHTGLCEEPAEELDRLMREMVYRPG